MPKMNSLVNNTLKLKMDIAGAMLKTSEWLLKTSEWLLKTPSIHVENLVWFIAWVIVWLQVFHCLREFIKIQEKILNNVVDIQDRESRTLKKLSVLEKKMTGETFLIMPGSQVLHKDKRCLYVRDKCNVKTIIISVLEGSPDEILSTLFCKNCKRIQEDPDLK
jgi:hypothetical protein